MKEKQLLTKELGAKIYSIIYLIAFLFYLIFIGIDIFTPLEDKTFDLLGNFLLYAGRVGSPSLFMPFGTAPLGSPE